MWIETVGNKYKFVERYKSTLTGRYKRVSVTYGKKTNQVKKAATQELEKRIRKALSKEQATDTDITFKELNDRFLAMYKKKSAFKTYQTNSGLLRKVEKDVGGNAIARKMSTTFWNTYIDKRLYGPSPVTNSTAKLIKTCISLSYQWGVRHGMLSTNPIKKVTIVWKDERSSKRNRIENKYLTHQEFRSIIDYCTQHNQNFYRDVIYFQYLTGLRFGELSALRVKDFFKKGNYYFVDVNGTMQYDHKIGKHFKSHSAKTVSGNRQVVLSKKAVDIAKRNAKGKQDDDWLFTHNITGKEQPIYINIMNSFLKKASAGIDKHVTTHIFRHTHVSNLADMGIPLRVIQKRVGHADSAMTRKIYLHVTKKTQREFESEVNLIDKTL